MIDQLPTNRPEWSCDIITITGNALNNEGELLTKDVELWRQNSIDCVCKLIGNPAFKDAMQFKPEMVFADADGKSCMYDEMWTGDWWWNIQVSMVIFSLSQYVYIPLGKAKVQLNCGTDNPGHQ
jgi:hypothetical protein